MTLEQAGGSPSGLTLVLSQWSVADIFWKPTDPTPFLYYALHKLLFSPDASAATVWAISVVCGVASVGLVFLLGRLVYGVRCGLIAALLLSVSNIHIDYSLEARAYSLLFMTTLGASVCLAAYLKNQNDVAMPVDRAGGRRLFLAGFALFCVVSFYTHLTAVFWIVAVNVILAAFLLKAPRKMQVDGLVAWIFMALLMAPGLYRMQFQREAGDSFQWLVHPNAIRFLYIQADLYFPMGLWDNDVVGGPTKIQLLRRIGLGISVLALFVLGFATLRPVLRRLARHRVSIAILLTYLLMPIFLWSIGYVLRPIYMIRTALFCLPGFFVLIGAMLSELPRRWMVATSSMFAVVSLAGAAMQGFSQAKSDWRGAAAFVADHAEPGDILVVCPGFGYPALRHATAAAIALPVLGYREPNTLTVLEKGLGQAPDWQKDYFDPPFSRTVFQTLPVPSPWKQHS